MIARDNRVTEEFFFVKCRPLFYSIMKLVFDYDSCVGCGQCVTQCRFDVRKMVPDERPVFARTKKRA